MNALALPDLAQAIEREHQAAHKAARTALEHALACGRLLLEAKGAVAHGQWLPWLEANTSVSARQSQRYMRLAGAALEGKYDATSHLTIEGALALLASPKTDKGTIVADCSAADERLAAMAAQLWRTRPLAEACEAGDREACRQCIETGLEVARLGWEISHGALVGVTDAGVTAVELTNAGSDEHVHVTAAVGGLAELVGFKRPVRVDALDLVLAAIGIDPSALTWRFVPGEPPIGLREMLFERAAP